MASFSTSDDNSASLNDESNIMKYDDSGAAKAADFANYFCSYAELYHQKQMLMDNNRMNAYYSAIMQNKEMFAGKIVLDVGSGSGVLAIWAAQAGAARVIAVEYTDMANHARKLVEANNLKDVVEVIQCSAEDLQLDCKVDIIVSEWMGYFLLRESMLDSVIRVRDKWLKPEGTLFPSHATMLWGAISYEEDRMEKRYEYDRSMQDWVTFMDDMKKYYKVDMSALDESFDKEQENYYVYSSLWTTLNTSQVVGQPCVLRTFDLNTCTIADAAGIDSQEFEINVPYNMRVSGFAGWFTVDFAGSALSPVKQKVILTTGPEGGETHWGQQVFYLPDAIDCDPNTKLHGNLQMIRQSKNQRLYNVRFQLKVDDDDTDRFVGTYEMP